jgi:hypothetical protein
MTNIFWIAANIIFDLGTGATTQVLMLVNRESDATIFQTEQEAQTYFSFVSLRSPHLQWFIDPPTPIKPQGWVIRGMQTTLKGSLSDMA